MSADLPSLSDHLQRVAAFMEALATVPLPDVARGEAAEIRIEAEAHVEEIERALRPATGLAIAGTVALESDGLSLLDVERAR